MKLRGFSNEDLEKLEIWRYMPLARLLSLLEFEAMWFSRLGALQDEFECTNPKGPRAFLLRVANNPKFKDAQTPMGVTYRDLLQMTDNGRSGDGGRRGGLVNCWFIGNAESEKMWKDYGDNGRGVAIRSTVKQLTTSFQITGDFAQISWVGRVEYVDFENFDLGSRGDDMAHAPFFKAKSYEEENEVRVVTLNCFHSGILLPDGSPPTNPGFSPAIKGLYIKCRLRDLLQSIVVGPNTDSNFHMLIKRLIARYGLVVNVERSKLASFAISPAEDLSK